MGTTSSRLPGGTTGSAAGSRMATAAGRTATTARTAARRIDALASLMGKLACLLACLLLAALGLQFARGCLCLASAEPCPTALNGQLPSEAFKQTAAVVAASLAPTP